MRQKRYVESLDEIVFEERNQEYGAFVIRKTYDRRVTLSLAVSFLFVLLVVGYPVLASYLDKTNGTKHLKKDFSVVLDSYKAEADILPPAPPPVEKLDPNVAKQIKYTIFEVVDSTSENQDIMTNIDLAANIGNKEVTLSEPTIVKPDVVVNEKPKVEETFISVEEMPQYPGGEVALQRDLASKVVYPEIAKDNGVHGKVYVRFVINSLGEVDKVQIARPVDPLLDAEAIRVVKLLQKWTPGKQQGTPVSVWYTVPINFTLAE